MAKIYYRPIPNSDACRPEDARLLAGGPAWFTHVERLEEGAAPVIMPAGNVPPEQLKALCAQRDAICDVPMDRMRLMGVLNVTPDSFSDGGQFDRFETAVAHAHAMVRAGCEILDIGGESTRPGAAYVSAEEEATRIVPVIRALRDGGVDVPISVDTRKALVAREAMAAGATLFNDVSALEFDAASLSTAAKLAVPVCLMHAQGLPETMQDDPRYGRDVLMEVYDYLEGRVNACLAAGIPRSKIIVDPGIGFGKTLAHNLRLLQGMSLFHGLGCTVLLGVSRKRFIGEIAQEPDAQKRGPGSIAVALDADRQGVQVIRVHDIAETAQALALWRACSGQTEA